ncbi:MAG: hypothetical protein RLY78_2209 [Pseudomonadota bacterium]
MTHSPAHAAAHAAALTAGTAAIAPSATAVSAPCSASSSAPSSAPPSTTAPDTASRPSTDTAACTAPATARQRVPLRQAAHGRTGDKGDRSNISLIAWDPALYPLLVEQITAARVAAHFAARRPRRVQRHLLPQLDAMNFVLDAALDGGVNDALNLDSHGKALSFHLLDLTLDVPAALLPRLRRPDLLPVPPSRTPRTSRTTDDGPAAG